MSNAVWIMYYTDPYIIFPPTISVWWHTAPLPVCWLTRVGCFLCCCSEEGCTAGEIADFTEEDIRTVRFWKRLELRQKPTVAVFNRFKTTESGCQKAKHLAWCLETSECYACIPLSDTPLETEADQSSMQEVEDQAHWWHWKWCSF